MWSASPLVRNDPRLPALVERLRERASLNEEARKMGYAHNGQLKTALRELIGTTEYFALMVERTKTEAVTDEVGKREAEPREAGKRAVGLDPCKPLALGSPRRTRGSVT